MINMSVLKEQKIMSAKLRTFIELEGTLEEIKAMLNVIKSYCGYEQDVSLDFPKISNKKKFDGKSDVLLKTLTEDSLDVFLTKCKKKVFVEADGPYGNYDRVDKAGLFEAIAEVAPNAKFKASTSGSTTGQSDDFTGELKKGKLNLIYRYLPDEYGCSDDEEWYTEKTTYDPIKKEYKKKYSEKDYVLSVIEKMPLSEFKEFFGLSELETSKEKYYDYIYECYCAHCCPELDYFLLKQYFPDAEIDEDEFERNVEKAIIKFGLVSFQDFCK